MFVSRSGIGLESSLLFAQEGANVLLVDINLTAAEKALALVKERFPNVKAAAIKADVGKEEDVKAAVDKAVELFGRLDIMVCVVRLSPPPAIYPCCGRDIFAEMPRTAYSSIMQVCYFPFTIHGMLLKNVPGIMHPEDDNALNTEERIWDLTMQINVKGVWWGCKYAILAMRKNPTDTARDLHSGGSIINTASFVAIMGAATPQLACVCIRPFFADRELT